MPGIFRRIAKWTALSLATVALFMVGAAVYFVWQASLRETAERTIAAPASGRFVHASDVDMYIQEQGPPDGPAILLVHAAGGWSGVWAQTAAALSSRGYRVIAVDMPPLGYSQRPAMPRYGREDQAKRLIAVLDALGVRQATILGHSFGARAAAQAVLANPDRVSGVVFVDGALSLQPDAPSLAGTAFATLMTIGPARRALAAATLTNPGFTRTLLTMFVADARSATNEWVDLYRHALNVRGTTAAVADWLPELLTAKDRSLSSDPEAYRTIKAPALIIWGDKDTVTPLSQGQHLAGLIPGARLVILPGVGHMPPIEDIDAFNAALLGFLEERRPAR